MPHDLTAWRAELQQILNACVQQTHSSTGEHHCGICAHYASANVPFEALLSLIDVMPAELRAEAIAAANDRLAGLPAGARRQQVGAVTLTVLMDMPSWPLVRSLVINISEPEISRCFDDPRLNGIEEVVLQWFNIDTGDVELALCEALTQSRGMVKVRALSFQLATCDAATSRALWDSEFVRRLERIDHGPFYGETIPGPMALRELSLDCGEVSSGFSFRSLLDRAITPDLKHLSLVSGHVGPLLAVLVAERELFERIEHVSLHLYADQVEMEQLRGADLASSIKSIIWKTNESRPDAKTHRDDKFTEYDSWCFEWTDAPDIPRGLETLPLILPKNVKVARVVELCREFPRLKSLHLIRPLTEQDFCTLLQSDQIRHLEQLALILDTHPSQRDPADPKHDPKYHSLVSAKQQLQWALGEEVASIGAVAITSQSCGIVHSPQGISCSVSTADALRGLVELNSQQRFNSLTTEVNLQLAEALRLKVDGDLARSLVSTGILGRTRKLEWQAPLDEEAAEVIGSCEQLRSVQAVDLQLFHISDAAIRSLLHSPHWADVWDVHISLTDRPERSATLAGLVATSPLLDRAVVLGMFDGPDDSPLVPQSGRLARLRRINEWLTIQVRSDARLAKVWAANPLGQTLRATLSDYVERVYRVTHTPADLPLLEQQLLAIDEDSTYQEFERAIHSLLATAFQGQPVPEQTKFADLTAPQQSALRTIAQLSRYAHNVNWPLRAYGFSFMHPETLETFVETNVH